jgi:MFS family permease
MSMLMVANIISNIISGILAYGIAQIHSSNGFHGWRWIFMIEGLMTIVVGSICICSNVSSPEKSSFLTQEEKDIIAATVESRKSTIGLASEWKIFLANPLNYVWASMFVFTCTTTYSISLFAPSIIQAFHPDWTTPQIQGHVIPIFFVSSVAALIAGYGADRLNNRLGFALVGYCFTVSCSRSLLVELRLMTLDRWMCYTSTGQRRQFECSDAGSLLCFAWHIYGNANGLGPEHGKSTISVSTSTWSRVRPQHRKQWRLRQLLEFSQQRSSSLYRGNDELSHLDLCGRWFSCSRLGLYRARKPSFVPTASNAGRII